MVNECSGIVTVIPPTGIDPLLVGCSWPTAGVLQGQDTSVIVTVKGGNVAKNVTFSVKKSDGTVCATTAPVSVPGDQANHNFTVSIPASTCLVTGNNGMTVAMSIHTGALLCTWDEFVQFTAAYGTKIGDAAYNPKFDLNGDGFIDAADNALYLIACPTITH